MEGECRASKCSLLCHDLHRLGYGKIVVDPGVQLAYEHWDAAGLHAPNVVRTSLLDLFSVSRLKSANSHVCAAAPKTPT